MVIRVRCSVLALYYTSMKLICPECKNEVDLSGYADVAPGHAVECQMCGITLKVTAIDDDKVEADIMDEGK